MSKIKRYLKLWQCKGILKYSPKTHKDENLNNSYIQQYKQYHSDPSKYPGNSYQEQHENILALVLETNSKSLLDYGCGKGLQYTEQKYHEAWGFMPSLYDPAVPQYETLPKGQFDGIYSTDVMEHIPKEIIPSVFDYIFSNATKFVYLGICTRPAVATLPNGKNAHCTVESIDWWVNMIEKHAPKKVYTHVKTYGNDNNYRILNSELRLIL